MIRDSLSRALSQAIAIIVLPVPVAAFTVDLFALIAFSTASFWYGLSVISWLKVMSHSFFAKQNLQTCLDSFQSNNGCVNNARESIALQMMLALHFLQSIYIFPPGSLILGARAPHIKSD